MFDFIYSAQNHERIRRTWLKLGNSLPDTLHHADALEAQKSGEEHLRIGAAKSVGVGLTDPCNRDLKIKTKQMDVFIFLTGNICVCLSQLLKTKAKLKLLQT